MDEPKLDCFARTSREPVPDGGILTIVFEDPARAGQQVQVVASDRDDPGAKQTVEIQLRGNGRGSGQLVVPSGWGAIALGCEGCAPCTIDVALPP